MEPIYICRVTCEQTENNLYRVDAVYDVMLIDDAYYLFNDRYQQAEIYKSDYHEKAWLTEDGRTARFLECN